MTQHERLSTISKIAEDTPTPFYCYFSERIRENFHRLKDALPATFDIYYSIKCNPHPDVAGILAKLGAGADVSSAGELEKALQAGFAPKNISFIGPGKSDVDLHLSLQHQIGRVVIESEGEAFRLLGLAKEKNVKQCVLLRLNLNNFINVAGRTMDKVPSQFGIDEDQVPALLLKLRKSGGARHLSVDGLHVFLGSQFLNGQTLIRNFHSTAACALRLSRDCDLALCNLNLGGGFGVPYFESQTELDISSFKSDWTALADSFPHTRLSVESGRYLVADAGYYVVRVVDRKVSHGHTYVIVDGGINHNLAATGIGQPIRRNFPVTSVNGRREKISVTIAGPTCYSEDVLGHNVLIPDPAIGDLLCFHNSGAYGPTFSPLQFLSRPAPLEIFVS